MNFLNKLKIFFSGTSEKQSTENQSETFKTGIVKFFNRSKGYGFIHSKELTTRIFVHVSELEDKVKVGDQVKFVIEKNERGLMAKNVEVV
ncbi:MAG: hypothetical protein DHS20C18_04060 [Saprospiraceae bacterium]|nr:MAG: hypothetical protein DHS20C18_04060 [Saprospiraceae bacterium]